MSITNKQWVQAKSPSDVTLEGVDLELDWDGSTINGVTLRDPKGNVLRIIKGEYSGMRAMVSATVEKYRLKGVALGIDIDQVFDTENDAERRKDEITDVSDKAQLVVEKVKVLA
jgi:hypothetical protein